MYQDGQTATNPQTGEKVVLQGGQWVPMGGGAPAPRQQAPGIIYGRPKPVDPVETERLRLAQAADARAAEDQARQNRNDQRGTIPAGYERKPDGSIGPMAGFDPAKTAKPNEGETKASAFLTRALGANISYEKAGVGPRSLVGQGMADIAPNVLNSLPGSVGNSPERQVSDSAQEEFIAASLRQDSGAAIPPEEMSRQRRIYFPMPGDGPEVIAQKRAARLRAIAGLKESAGSALADDQAQILKQFDPDIQAALRGEASAPGGALTIKFGDEAAPVTGSRLSAAQQGEIEQAMRVGDEGQALALLQRYSGNPPTPGTVASIKAGIDALRRDPKTPVAFDYGAIDAAATSADEKERFGDNLAPAMEQRKDLIADPIVRGVADIVPFSDEIAATGNTIFGGGTYADNLRRERAIDEADSRVNSAQRIGGQIGGAAIPVGRILGFGRTAGGVARSAASYGREGAVLGGAYAAGKADPSPDVSMGESIAKRAAAAPVGAAIGGGAAYGLGALVNRMGRNKPPGSGGPGDGARDIAAAAAEEGIDLLPADTGGPITRGATAIARQGWLSEGPISARAMRSAAQAGQARTRAAGMAGQALEKDDAGEIVRKGADIYSKQTGKTGDALYTRAYKMAGDTKAPLPKAIAAADESIAELSEAPVGSALLDEIKAIRSQIAKGNFTVRGIRDMRTRLREEADFKGLRGSDTSRRLGQIIDAASEDVATALESAGKQRAAKAFRTADDFWRQRVETIDGVLDPLLGKNAPRSGEKILGALEGMANKETGNAANLRRVMKALPDNEANSVRATIINRLGADGDGADFSFAKFLTRWNGMSSKAKTVLFPPESIKALNNIATVARGAKATAAYSNTSNTGRAVAGQILLSSLVSGAGGLATAGAAGAGQIISGRLLASPLFGKFLMKLPKVTDPKVISNSLSTIARRDPAIAQDVLGLQQRLTEAFAQAPLRAAASDQEKK